MIRIGHGYDVHTLVTGRDLVLGGVKIPHSKGLHGHSDADVLIHAICDAASQRRHRPFAALFKGRFEGCFDRTPQHRPQPARSAPSGALVRRPRQGRVRTRAHQAR